MANLYPDGSKDSTVLGRKRIPKAVANSIANASLLHRCRCGILGIFDNGIQRTIQSTGHARHAQHIRIEVVARGISAITTRDSQHPCLRFVRRRRRYARYSAHAWVVRLNENFAPMYSFAKAVAPLDEISVAPASATGAEKPDRLGACALE